MLDVMIWLFGAPSSLTAHRVNSVRRFQQYSGDDISNVIMRWDPANIIGHIHLSRVAHKQEESIVVTGTTGTLLLEGNKVILKDALGSQTFEMTDTSTKQWVVRSMLRKFGDYVTGRAAEYPSSLANLADTIAVIEATKRSFVTSQAESLLPVSESQSAHLAGEHHVWPLITSESVDAVVQQMYSSLSIYDRSNVYETFENRWRKMHGLKHALVCNSGTIAILVRCSFAQIPPTNCLCPLSICSKPSISAPEIKSFALYIPFLLLPALCYNMAQYLSFAMPFPTATSILPRFSKSRPTRQKLSS